MYLFCKEASFYGELVAPRPTPSSRTATCRLSVTAYAMYL